MTALISDRNLAQVLSTADIDDLAVLIDHITDKGEGRISLRRHLQDVDGREIRRAD